MAQAGRLVMLKIPGDAVSMTNEVCSTSDNLTYTIDDTTKRVIGPNASITVYDGGVETAESYTVNRLTGQIIFSSAVARVITVTSQYLPLSEAGGGNEFTLSLSGNNEDSTIFGKNFVTREQTLKDVSASISGFYIDSYFRDMLNDDTIMVIEFYLNRTGSWHAKMWTRLSSDEISGSVDGLVEQSVECEGTLDADSRAIVFNS